MRYPSYMRRHKKAASVREPVSLYEAKTHLSELVEQDRKSTRLNSSHSQISYAVFCLKKKNNSDKHHSPVACSPARSRDGGDKGSHLRPRRARPRGWVSAASGKRRSCPPLSHDLTRLL